MSDKCKTCKDYDKDFDLCCIDTNCPYTDKDSISVPDTVPVIDIVQFMNGK